MIDLTTDTIEIESAMENIAHLRAGHAKGLQLTMRSQITQRRDKNDTKRANLSILVTFRIKQPSFAEKLTPKLRNALGREKLAN